MLAEKMGGGGGGGQHMAIVVGWSALDGPFSLLYTNGCREMLLLLCRGSISGTVGSFQSGQAFTGWRSLVVLKAQNY